MVCLQICKQICFLQNALFQHDCNLNHSYAFHFYDLFSSLGSGPLGFFRYFIGRKLVCVRIVPTLCKKMSVAESNPSVGFGEEHGANVAIAGRGVHSNLLGSWRVHHYLHGPLTFHGGVERRMLQLALSVSHVSSYLS